VLPVIEEQFLISDTLSGDIIFYIWLQHTDVSVMF